MKTSPHLRPIRKKELTIAPPSQRLRRNPVPLRTRRVACRVVLSSMVNQDVATVVAHTDMEWWPLLLLLGVLGSIGWVIIAAGTVMEKGESMDRSERIAQLYGYTV